MVCVCFVLFCFILTLVEGLLIANNTKEIVQQLNCSNVRLQLTHKAITQVVILSTGKMRGQNIPRRRSCNICYLKNGQS